MLAYILAVFLKDKGRLRYLWRPSGCSVIQLPRDSQRTAQPVCPSREEMFRQARRPLKHKWRLPLAGGDVSKYEKEILTAAAFALRWRGLIAVLISDMS